MIYYLAIILGVLALLVAAARTARRMKPKETWVCRDCADAFSSEARIMEHRARAHGETVPW